MTLFERLRNEDPLHWCKEAWMSDERPDDMEPVGAYWSVTRYEDIMAIDTDHHRFSSEPAIVLPNPAEDFLCLCSSRWISPSMIFSEELCAPIVASPSLSKCQS